MKKILRFTMTDVRCIVSSETSKKADCREMSSTEECSDPEQCQPGSSKTSTRVICIFLFPFKCQSNFVVKTSVEVCFVKWSLQLLGCSWGLCAIFLEMTLKIVSNETRLLHGFLLAKWWFGISAVLSQITWWEAVAAVFVILQGWKRALCLHSTPPRLNW